MVHNRPKEEGKYVESGWEMNESRAVVALTRGKYTVRRRMEGMEGMEAYDGVWEERWIAVLFRRAR